MRRRQGPIKLNLSTLRLAKSGLQGLLTSRGIEEPNVTFYEKDHCVRCYVTKEQAKLVPNKIGAVYIKTTIVEEPPPLMLSEHIVNLVHLMRQYGDVEVHGFKKGKKARLDTCVCKTDTKTSVGIDVK